MFVYIKISKSIGIIYRYLFYLSSKSKLALYYSLVYPYLSYCNITWSSTYVTNLNRIFNLQKRAVRVLTNSDFRTHSAPLFLQLKILDIFKLNPFHVEKIYVLIPSPNTSSPIIFSNLFLLNNQVHNYYTRSADDYRSHNCRTNTHKKKLFSFKVRLYGILCLPTLRIQKPNFVSGKGF